MRRYLCMRCLQEVRDSDLAEDGNGHAVVVIRTRTGSAHAPDCFGDCDRHGCPIPVPEPYEDLDLCGPVEVFFLEDRQLGMVREWHEAFGLPVRTTPTLDAPGGDMRCTLIEEETRELREAFDRGDVVEVADALADILVTVYGAALTWGIPIETIAEEVHRSNMTKRGPDGSVVRREDGKILKGPHFSPPDLGPILKAAEAPF